MNTLTLKQPTSLSYRLAQVIFIACAIWLFFGVSPELAAQTVDRNAAFSNPQVSSGLSEGINETLRWIFLILKALAIVACGWGSYKLWEGNISTAIYTYLAALTLFFAPTLVNLAQNIGRVANN